MGKKNVTTDNSCNLTSDEKTFDEIMDEILGKDDENRKTDIEEFEEKISDVARPCDFIDYPNSVEEKDNTIRYSFSDDAVIALFNGFSLDTGLGDGYRENTVLETSHYLNIYGRYNTRDMIIRKHNDSERFGHIEFFDSQKVNSLIIENTGVFGSFDVAMVSIHDSSYVDIDLDITDMTKCTYLLIDMRFNRVRGKINMSKGFYNQLNDKNKTFLKLVSKQTIEYKNNEPCIKILVDNVDICDVTDEKIDNENLSIMYQSIKDILNRYNIDD